MQSAVKIRAELPDGPVAGENLWAIPLGEGRYRLANIPFYADGLAEGDIVRCVERDGWPTIVEVMEGGGNGTIRILFAEGADEQGKRVVLDELVSVGCTYEGASVQWVAITVPPDLAISLAQLSAYLNATDDALVTGWEVGKRPAETRQA